MANIRIPKDYTKKTMRSAHNRSCIRRSPIHPGLGIPIYSRRVMAGEKVYIDPVTVLQTNALKAPLMGSFRLQLAVFFDSDANYYGWMDNNTKLTTQELLNRMRHRCKLSTVVNALPPTVAYSEWLTRSGGVAKSSILNYHGFPSKCIPVKESGGDDDLNDPYFDLGFILTYLNIFRRYYANDQEPDFPLVLNDHSDGVTSPLPIRRVELSILDDLFRELRFLKDGIDLTPIPDQSQFPGLYWLLTDYLENCNDSFGGLFCCKYQPDLMVNLLSAANVVDSYVNTTGSSFTINTLRFRNKIQRLIDRYDISGGRMANWLRAVWGVKTNRNMDVPEIIGVTQKLIDPTELTTKSNSGAIKDEPARFVGDLAANFNKTDAHRGHSFYASTSGRVMVIATLVPNVDYVQGIDYEVTKVSFADDYVPEFAQLGYQSVPLSRYCGLPVFDNNESEDNFEDPLPSDADVLTRSVGREVAWLPEMTDVNRNFGEFDWCGQYNYWVLNRLYSRLRYAGHTDGQINLQYKPEITQYINPLDYQYPFVAQTITDPNWFLQVGLKIKANRPIGKRFMPNLE